MTIKPDQLLQDEIILRAKEAYTYGFPLVLMNLTKMVQTSVPFPQNGHAPVNQIGKAQTFPTSDTQDVVKPNVDTYYNLIWFDLSVGAFVLNVPNTDQSMYFPDPDDENALTGPRYYLLPFLDAYSNVFASHGTRLTGSAAQLFFITGPDWSGTVPDNMLHIPCPTNMVWMLGRVQANNDADGNRVVWPIEQQLKLTPYTEWNNSAYNPPVTAGDSTYDGVMPLDAMWSLTISDYFNMLSQLMAENPAPAEDQPILTKMASIGVGPGLSFDINSFLPDTIDALEAIPKNIVADWEKVMPAKMFKDGSFQNNWINFLTDIGVYGTDYLQRAFIAFKGLGANIIADAIYPVAQVDSERNQLKSNTNYKITMAANQLPDVNAFWSLTAYNQADFLVVNDAGIYSVGSRGGLIPNSDGSYDIYIQPTQPADTSLNWLPSPQTPGEIMSLTMRLYWPGDSVISGDWAPPSVILNQ